MTRWGPARSADSEPLTSSDVRLERSIPAYAGTTRSDSVLYARPAAHPRVGGDHQISAEATPLTYVIPADAGVVHS